MKLSLASFLSDRIVDEILEALSSSQLTLVQPKTACLFCFFPHSDCSQLEALQLHICFTHVSHSLFYLKADHLVRRGRPLVQQESVDLDVPEEKVAKRASTEILEGERLDDLESCMVGQSILEFSGFDD